MFYVFDSSRWLYSVLHSYSIATSYPVFRKFHKKLSCNTVSLCLCRFFRFLSKADLTLQPPLREKCSYSEFFLSVFSRIRTEYGMWENISQKKSEYGSAFLVIGSIWSIFLSNILWLRDSVFIGIILFRNVLIISSSRRNLLPFCH